MGFPKIRYNTEKTFCLSITYCIFRKQWGDKSMLSRSLLLTDPYQPYQGAYYYLEPILAQKGGNQEASCLGENMGPVIKVFLFLLIYSCAFLLIIYNSWPLAVYIALHPSSYMQSQFLTHQLRFCCTLYFSSLSFQNTMLPWTYICLETPMWIMLPQILAYEVTDYKLEILWTWYWLKYLQHKYLWIWSPKNIYMIKMVKFHGIAWLCWMILIWI